MFRYETIARELQTRIEQGAYPSGRLPAERAISEEFQVQRDTIRNALEVLIRDGLLLRDSTRGTYVAPRYLSGSETAAAKVTGTVLLSVRTFDDALAPTAVFTGLSRFLAEHGLSTYWYDAGDKNYRPESISGDHFPTDELFRMQNISGIALWPQTPIPNPLDELGAFARKLPIVLIDRELDGFPGDFVGFADFDAGRDMARHLLRIGHRRIGFLSGEAWTSSVQAREAGYISALAEEGASPTALHREGGRRVLDSTIIHSFLAGGGDPLTAIMCSNDIVAARLIRFLRSESRRVPEDVAVTGFGDLLPSVLDAFGITTVAQPFEELGRTAGQVLLSRMDGTAPKTPRHIELPMRLIVRESCGSRARFPLEQAV